MDNKILDFIAKNLHSKWLDYIMHFFTIIGEAGIFMLIISLICLLQKKHRRIGIIILFSALLGFVIGNLFLKNIIARDRPCTVFPENIYFIDCASGYSFPSGHTLHSFIPAFVLLFNKRIKASIIVFVLASLIAFSRMYFYVHYFTDILVGFILAAIIAFFTTTLFNKQSKLKKIFKYD